MFRGKSDTFILGHDDMTIGTHFTSDGRYLKRRVRFCSQKRCNRKKISPHVFKTIKIYRGGGLFIFLVNLKVICLALELVVINHCFISIN